MKEEIVMRKILAVSAIAALGLGSVAFAGGLPEEMPIAPVAAADAGFYLGIAGGYGLTGWDDAEGSYLHSADTIISKVASEDGFAGRLFAGYDFNRYFAVEAGYSYFFNKVKFKDGISQEFDKVKNTQVIDLMGKIKAPVVDGFDLYAKLGADYQMSNFDHAKNRKNFNVAYGAGADYYITSNVIANIEWLRFNGDSELKSKDYQPAADAFMVGLRYKFDI